MKKIPTNNDKIISVNILPKIGCFSSLFATPLTLVYGLFEWIITGDGKVAYWLFQHGVLASIVGLFYYFMCCMLSKADDREKERAI